MTINHPELYAGNKKKLTSKGLKIIGQRLP